MLFRRRKGPKDWRPGDRLEFLEALARELVGDGKSPNLFFVSSEGNVILISRDFDVAYLKWKQHAQDRDHESALEDRQYGVISSVEPSEDESGRLVVRDDSRSGGFRS